MRGNSTVEQSAGIALNKEALTEATTAGESYMKRCFLKMRSKRIGESTD